MAESEQRAGAPAAAHKWVPPVREAAPTALGRPRYPSFSASVADRCAGLTAAIASDPEGTAGQLARALAAGDARLQLEAFAAALQQQLQPGRKGASLDASTLARLAALEAAVSRLQERPAPPVPDTASLADQLPAVQPERLRTLVAQRPEDSAKVVRTMLAERMREGLDAGTADTWSRRVGIVGVSLGEELLGEVMKHLGDADIRTLTRDVGRLANAMPDEVDDVLARFEEQLVGRDWITCGGPAFVQSALERAVGPQKARELLEIAAPQASSGFYMLKNVAPAQIAPFISHEHPQTVALILSQLEPAQASGILALLPERMQADVAYRIATMENITPNVIKQIEGSLESSLRDILGGNQDVGGPKVVADVLNLTGASVEKSVLDQMDALDPQVAEAIRNRMFVFSDIAKLTDREIQTLLREVDQKDLIVALKAADEELKDKILGNVSQEARKRITDELEFLGPMRLSEVEEIQLRIVQQVRQLEEKGQITVVRGDADDQFV